MGSPLTIACVYRTGGDYTGEYVRRLQSGFEQHCHAPFRFLCLTNTRVSGVECVPLRHNWPGWWSKLELFYLQGPVVYCDLDTLVLNDITDICAYPHTFSVTMGLARFPGSIGGGERDFNSTFMAWNQDLSHIPAAFNPSCIPEYSTRAKWGDQAFIQEHLARPADKMQDIFPGRIVHYKSHVRCPDKSPGLAPQGASVICFSGNPRPHQLPADSWLFRQWSRGGN